MHKIRLEQDLLLVFSFSLTFLLMVYVGSSQFLRVPFGFIYILLVPGYTLVAALFPNKHALTGINRLILSLGLSITVVPLIGLVLNYTFWGISLDSILVSTLAFILLNCNVAFYRRSKLPIQERFIMRLDFSAIDWRNIKPLDVLLSVALTFSIMVALGALIYAVARPKVGERFTDFYILGPNGIVGKYPEEAVAGEPIVLTFGVVNHERSDVQYYVEVAKDEGTIQLASPRLGHEETWEQPYAFTLTKPGENRKVTFLLYKGDDEEPYRSLHLWITVKEKPIPTPEPEPTPTE